ncbi:hypothetical protein [Capillimicrobium parvum]|nr:hypothetical protein [Capillimicrobium parvum]
MRVLFCFGVLPAFFEIDDELRQRVARAIKDAYSDLDHRFGVRVIGTMDDDRGMVGPTLGYPWTAYILADAPDYDAVVRCCDVLREIQVGDDRLWRFMKVEARVGRELFFGS